MLACFTSSGSSCSSGTASTAHTSVVESAWMKANPLLTKYCAEERGICGLTYATDRVIAQNMAHDTRSVRPVGSRSQPSSYHKIPPEAARELL